MKVGTTAGVLPGTIVITIALVVTAVCATSTSPATPAVIADVAPSPTLRAKPPAIDEDTIVLFDGKTWTGWHQNDGSPSLWETQADGSVLVKGGNAITDAVAGDFQLHVEFYLPLMADKKGQGRANSGVYLHGRYEIQVLDTYGLEPASNGCGGIYSIAAPMVNASRPPDQWQTYDIVFRAPRFDTAGGVAEPARVTVIQNGIVIHNNLDLTHATGGNIDDSIVPTGPLMLQFHGNPVRYRNIWMRHLN